ncbi:uncharacterized protein [Macrobrachium rosenbergii]|uniref:uncharacterized protein isoform X2 n=2 Tax=Macrobrachium rosenbergii TaxID=79674 RepID=UPI0034D7AE72
MNATGTHSSGLLASSPSAPSSASSAAADIRNSSGTMEEEVIVASLSLPYVVCEVLVAVMAVIGNALTIVVFVNERKLRRLTNYYIVSLALADLLVGMPGIPFAILTSVGIPRNSYMCPPMLSLLLMLCTVSIFCLVAVSVDRYWAILYPLRYSRVMTAKIARRIILLCWLAGIFLGFLPLMGWRQEYQGDCYFVKVMHYDYLVFIYFSTIVFPGILMAFFYTHIYTVVLKQLRQIAAQEPQSEAGSVCTQHGGSQRQRPHFLISRSQSRSHSEVNRCDSRRCSTSTNIVHQLPIPRTSKLWPPKSFTRRCLHPLDFFQHTSLRHLGPTSPSDEGTTDTTLRTTSPSCQTLLHSNHRHHHHHHHHHHQQHSSLFDLRNQQEESLHHSLLRHNFEGALKRSSEELRSKSTRTLAEDERTTLRKEEAKNPDGTEKRRYLLSNSQESSGNMSRKEEEEEEELGEEDEDAGEEEDEDLCAMTPMIRISKVKPEAEGLGTPSDDLTSARPFKNDKPTKRFLTDRTPEKSSACKDHHGSRGPRRSEDAGSRRSSTLSYVLYQVTHANKREVKAAKSLSIIVLFFLICWFPLYTINCVQAFCETCPVTPEFMYFTIILTHVNSAVNPFLYAYHMKDFRHALKAFILEKILRRRLHSEPLSHRSLVSPHHSTLYRVAVGGGSPQLANFHTPHTHNTPIQSSPSPVAGTPSGIRSRSSTLGSYGHWLQSKGVSSTTSLGKTPEDKDEPLSRPRAATITSHTSPASVHSAEEACLKKPLLSASNLLTLTHDSCGGEITEHQTVSSSSDAVTINFSATDPTEVVVGFDQYSDGLSVITDDSLDQHVGVIPTFQLNDSKLPPGNITPLSDAFQNSTTPLTAESSLEFVKKSADSTELSSASGGDETSFYSRNITSEAMYNRPVGRNADSENKRPLGPAKCLSDHDMCDIERSITDDGKKFSESTLSQNCLTRENKPNGTDHSINSSSGKRLAASETNMSQIPNGTDDNITSSSTGKYESTNNCDAIRKESEIVRLEETPKQPRKHEATVDESSPLTQEFYRYLPKMLRKKDENKKSKCARTGKGWLSSMMRNRSYHGLSVEVAGSKQLPRAKSISGAMDT